MILVYHYFTSYKTVAISLNFISYFLFLLNPIVPINPVNIVNIPAILATSDVLFGFPSLGLLLLSSSLGELVAVLSVSCLLSSVGVVVAPDISVSFGGVTVPSGLVLVSSLSYSEDNLKGMLFLLAYSCAYEFSST